MFHVSVFPDWLLICVFLAFFPITMHEIDTAAEVHSEPFQTYMIEISLHKELQLLPLNSNLYSIIKNWHDCEHRLATEILEYSI